MTQKFKHPLKLMIVLGWAIAISLCSITPTFAKGPNVRPTVPTTKSREPQSRTVAKSSEKARIVRVKLVSTDGKELTNLSPADRKKIMASLAKHFKAAGAAAVTFVSGDTGCFNDCVGTLGATPMQLILCGNYCGMWEDPNGRVFCAICLGLDVMSVNGCAFQCGALIN